MDEPLSSKSWAALEGIMFSFYRGQERQRTKREHRNRNTTVVIDESGDLGEGGTKKFTIVATVVKEIKDFEEISKMLTYRSGNERKAANASDGLRERALVRIIDTNPDIYDISKSAPKGKRTPEEKEDIYIRHIEELLEKVLASEDNRALDLLLDDSPIQGLDEERFIQMCIDVAERNGKKLDWVEMRPSATEKMLQVHDYITYVIGGDHENKDVPEHRSHRLVDILKCRRK